MQKLDGCSLADDYKDFHKPVAKVYADGEELAAGEGTYLESAEVFASAGREPDMAVLVYRVYALSRKEPDAFEKKIAVGQRIELKAGYGSLIKRIFLGYLHEAEACSGMEGYVEYTLLCLDVKALMKKNSVYQISGAQNTGQILNEILDTARYQAYVDKKEVDGLPQAMNRDCVIKGETHYDWLCQLAEYLDYEFFCGRGSLVFRRAQKGDRLLTLSQKSGLLMVRARVSLAGQTGNISVGGYNRKDTKLAAAAQWPGAPGPFGRSLAGALQGFTQYQWDMGLETGEQAAFRAQAAMRRAARQCSRMAAVNMGIPEIEPGICIELEGETAGSLTGSLYVDEVCHLLDGNGYRTVFKGARMGV